MKPLLVLIALVLELPEDYFIKLHDYNEASDDYLCYVCLTKYRSKSMELANLPPSLQKIYHPRTDEEWKAIDGKFRPGRACIFKAPSIGAIFH